MNCSLLNMPGSRSSILVPGARPRSCRVECLRTGGRCGWFSASRAMARPRLLLRDLRHRSEWRNSRLV
jgi:hypothetical protein